MKRIRINLGPEILLNILGPKGMDSIRIFPGIEGQPNVKVTVKPTEALVTEDVYNEIITRKVPNYQDKIGEWQKPDALCFVVTLFGDVKPEPKEKTKEELLEDKIKSLEAKLEALTGPKRKAGRPRKVKPEEKVEEVKESKEETETPKEV